MAGLDLIIGGLGAAARFLPLAWRASWAMLALTAVATGLALGQAPVWWLAAAVLAIVTRGGLWRLALDLGRPGPSGYQLSAIEARLAAVWALSGLFLAILAMLTLVVLLCCAYAAASAGLGFNGAEVATWTPAIQGGGRVLLGAAGALGAAGMVYAAARISLAEAASVAREKVQVLSAWTLTRRRAFGLAVANLAVAAPAIVLWLARGAGWPWLVAESFVIVWLWLPMSIGLMAYAYQAAEKP
ncbi:MAG TPA: hypothetical protein VIJ59_01685 [Caulobacteraceae bacterium]